MLLDVKKIELRLSEGDEWCLYKVTRENKQQRFLLFSFGNDWRHAYDKGKAIARVLKVGFTAAEAPSSTPTTKEEKVEFGRKKRVTGASRLCRQMLSNGSGDEEIMDAIMEKYITVGHGEKHAEQSARYILKAEKGKQR